MLRARTALLVLPLLLTLACAGDDGEATDTPAVDADGDGYTTVDDCDDSNAAINPGATENCEEDVDYDCDGSTNYDDQDKDGFAECVDCDDLDNQINPNAIEICDQVDNDCDELIDSADDSLEGGTEYFADTDKDDLGDADSSVFACELPDGYVENDLDCDDADENSGEAGEWFEDKDEDTYGATTTRTVACEQPTGFVAQSGDCDDDNDAIKPGAPEICDDKDNDCDGETDDDDPELTEGRLYFVDADEDGYGDEDIAGRFYCERQTEGFADEGGDCDDTIRSINPGMPFDFDDDEDNDCDTSIDEDVGKETYSHASDIQPIWNSLCTGCHGRSGGLSLTSAYGAIVSQSSSVSGYDYIEPGLPEFSYLFRKLEGTHTDIGGSGLKMPRSGSISSADVSKIETWIEEGAVK